MPYQRANSPYYYLGFTPEGYDREVRKSAGVKSLKRARAIEATLNRLGRQGDHEILDRIVDGELAPRRVYAMIEAGRKDELAGTNGKLHEAIARFRNVNADERLDYAFDRLRDFVPAAARVSWLVDPRKIQLFIQHAYRDAGLAANTERRELQGVRQLIAREFDEETAREVWRDVDLRPEPRTRVSYLERDEIEAVQRAAGEWWTVFGLALATGLRRGELHALQRRDLDLDRGLVTVEAGKTDLARRTVPVGGGVLERLRDHVRALASSAPVFDTSYPTLGRRWRAIADRAGVDASMHSLRHTYAVHMARAGMDLEELKRRLGHRNLSTTSRYAQYRPRARTERYERGLSEMGLERTDEHTVGSSES